MNNIHFYLQFKHLLPSFQFIDRFDISRYIIFVVYLLHSNIYKLDRGL